MTHIELALSIWKRRKPGTFSTGMTRKQVDFFKSLWSRDTRDGAFGHMFPIYHDTCPLTVVVYPNGAGFIKVADHAIEPIPGGWRFKEGYQEP